jgi:hypothetical protein
MKKIFSLFLLSFFAFTNVAAAIEPMIIEEPVMFERPMIEFEPLEPYFEDDPYVDDPYLEVGLAAYVIEEGKVALEWEPYLGNDFLWYKIMHSQENGYPYYPVDDYLDYYEDHSKTGFIHEDVPFGDNYYVICVITVDSRRGCSNSEYIWMEPMGEFDEPFVDKPEFERPFIENKIQERDLLGKFLGWVKNNFAVFLAILTVVLATSGFTFATRRKRQSISKHMNQIDDTYSEYKMKAKRCEAELYRLKDIIDEELKGGKLEDTSYQLLMNRIEGYMVDVQKQIVNEKFGGLPGSLKEQMFMMMEDGEITEKEMETMQKLIKRSELSASEQDSLLQTMKEFKNQDEMMKKRGKKS